MDSPMEFIQYMGWEHKLVGTQIEIKECPFCHADDYKFRMNSETGLWDCKHGNRHNGKNEKGNLFTLRKALGLTVDVAGKNEPPVEADYTVARRVENAHARLMQNPALLQVLLDEWGIRPDTVAKYKLGYVDDGHSPMLTIPHIIDDIVYNVKSRSWFGYPKTFFRVKDASSVLLNEEKLRAPFPKRALLTEGEKDGIVADDCGVIADGLVDVIIGMTGGAGTLLERWYTLLESVEVLYVAYDGDGAGESGMDTIIRRLGAHRIRVVEMPKGMDVADVVKKFGADELKRRIREAREPKIRSVLSHADVLDRLMTMGEEKWLPTPWPGVTRILAGGTLPGHLVSIIAPPKIGKTSTCLEWANYHAAVCDTPSLVWCVEMPAHKLGSMVVSIQTGSTRRPSKAEIYCAKQKFSSVPIYYGFSPRIKPEVLIQTFRDCYMRFGVRSFWFDNVHFAVRGSDDMAKDIGVWIKNLKEFSMEYMSHVFAVGQPNKVGIKSGANLDYSGAAWSTAFATDSDAIIILHRDRVAGEDESFRPEMLVKVDAGRETQGGVTWLRLQRNSLRYRDMGREEIKAMRSI